jgi:hypothetical protein
VAAAAALTFGALLPLAAAQPGLAAQAATAREAVHAVQAAPGQERVVRRSVAAARGGRLDVELETGGNLEIEGWDRDEVSLEAELGGADWRGTRVSLERASEGVRLASVQHDAGGGYSTSHRFRLRVPSAFDVAVTSNGGAIQVVGVTGRLSGHTNGGGVWVERSRGRAELSTNGGEIQVIDSRLEGQVHTNSGDVILQNVQGGLQGETGAGQVIRTAEDSRSTGAEARSGGRAAAPSDGPVVITRGGGAISVENAPMGADLRTGGGNIVVRRARGLVKAQTGGGEITLSSVEGPVSASTGAGDVFVGLAGVGGSGADVDVFSGNGRVEIVIPAGFDADLEIEAAYTTSRGERVDIHSDFPLRRTESTSWETGHGTPRKFVRGSTRLGRGGARVRVRTVNGDVVVRSAGRVSARRAPAGGDVDCTGGTCVVDRTGAVDCTDGTCVPASPARAPSSPASDAGFRRDEIQEVARRLSPGAAAVVLERMAFEERDPEAQRQATIELGKIGGRPAVQPLVRIALSHPGEEARREAARALGREGGELAHSTLRRVAETDEDPGVRREARRAADRAGSP